MDLIDLKTACKQERTIQSRRQNCPEIDTMTNERIKNQSIN